MFKKLFSKQESDVNKDFVNLAYTEFHQLNLEKYKNCVVLDLCSTPVESVIIDSFSNLKRLRTQRCMKLKTLKVTNCPNLEIIDTSYSIVETENFILDNLPKLRCLDISFTKIKSFGNYVFPCLQCLLMKNQNFVPSPSIMPNLLTLELGNISSDLFDDSFFTFEKLERLIFFLEHGNVFKIENFASMKNLQYLYIYKGETDLSAFPEETKLKYLMLKDTKINNKKNINVPYYYLNTEFNQIPPILNEFPDWVESYRLLYGPWGIPPCDQMKEKPKIIKTRLPFDESFTNDVIDSILGAVFGSALGDSLGVKSEFHKNSILHFELGCPLDISWSHMCEVREIPMFMLGCATDDTDQSVFIMRSLKKGKPDVNYFAHLMYEWSINGIIEHKQGYCYDIGITTANSVRHPDFLKDPHKAAQLSMSEFSVGNGSAMRTSSVGCFHFWDEETVMNNAKIFGQATHYHKSCTFACVCVSLLVARFIQKRAGLIKDVNIDEVVDISMKFADASDDPLLHVNTLEELKLDGKDSGYSIRALGCALFCLRQNYTYEQAMTIVVSSGGDADTNAAIVGAVLGAKYGFHALPERLVKYLYNGNWIYKDLAGIIAAMGIKPPESPFNKLSYE